MASYGVGVSNPFDLLTEDGAAPKQAKPTEDKKDAAKGKKPAGSKPILPQTGPAEPLVKPGAARGAPARGRGSQRGAAARTRGRGGQNRGTGHDAHPVLPGGAHAGAAHGQRPFERRSGSGRGREQRKGGAGGYAAAGTWKDDIAAEGGVEAVASEAAAPSVTADAPADGAAPAVEEPAPEEFVETEEMKAAREEEEKEAAKLTYDQFVALKEAKKVADDAKLAVRKVEIDEKRFKPVNSFTREQVVMFDDTGKPGAKGAAAAPAKAAEQKKEAAAAAEKKKKEKKLLNIDEFKMKFGGDLADAAAPAAAEEAAAPAPAASRGGRGGRGGARGAGAPRGGARGAGFGARGGRGAPRGGRGGAFRADIQSEEAFPKLGK